MSVEVGILGPLEARVAGRVVEVRGERQRRLACILTVHRGEVVSSDRLIDLVWEDADPPGKARNALQAQVSQLRRSLGSDVVLTEGAGYVLDLGPDRVDAGRFELLVGRGRRLLEDEEPVAAAASLREALELWRGPALDDVSYCSFAQPAISALEEMRLEALEARIEADMAAGRSDGIVGELEALTAEHPVRERLWSLRMLALYRAGRQADALRCYAEARRHLVEEMGIEPGPQLRELEGLVLAQDRSLDAVTRRAADSGRGNLRVPLTSLVGRDAEIDQVVEASGRARIVTLIGPGGVGKTRLALAAAGRLADSVAEGAYVVELARVEDPEAVPGAVASALGVRGEDPEVAGGSVDQIASYLAGRSLVLVVDNCEHLVEAAAALVESLASAVPGLQLLATSRERLGVPGEVLVSVEPLPGHDAVHLFIERSRAVHPELDLEAGRELVEEISRRLDGLPLAIELAAARTRSMSLGEIARRLDDRFRLLSGGVRTAEPRQRTLRAVVDWSYDLLDPDERRLLGRLAVFVGGCSLEAVEQVCSEPDLFEEDIADHLARLVDKSLVQARADEQGGIRYWLLQTIREDAIHRLEASGDAGSRRRRHANWFARLAARAELGLRGSEIGTWVQHLRLESGNLRAALDHVASIGDAAAALQIATAVAWLRFLDAEWAEGAAWLEDALAVPGDVPVERAQAQSWLAYFSAQLPIAGDPRASLAEPLTVLRQAQPSRALAEALLLDTALAMRAGGEEAVAAALLAEAAAVIDAIDYTWAAGIVDLFSSHLALASGRIDEAVQRASRGAERCRESGNHWGLIEASMSLGMIAEVRGDYPEALPHFEEGHRLAALSGFATREAMMLMHVANIHTLVGDPGSADELHGEALRKAGDPTTVAFGLNGRGLAARRLGDVERARRYHREAMAVYEAAGVVAGRSLCLARLSACAVEAGEPNEAVELAREALALARRAGDRRGEALAAECLACAAVLAGDPTRAARLLGTAAAIREATGGPLSSGERLEVDRAEDRARAELGDGLFEEAASRGAGDTTLLERELLAGSATTR